MEPSSQKDLWLVIVLSIVGLALIWLSPLQLYPSSLAPYISLIPYVLLFFLPGYAIITAIKPNNDGIGPVNRIAIGVILGSLFLLITPIVFNYFKFGYIEIIPTLLLLLAIFFSIVAILRRRKISSIKEREHQLTLDESVKRIQVIKKESKEKAVLSEEMDEYAPMPEELEDPSQKNRMSVMRLFDTGERPEADKKLQKDGTIKDKKPIRDEILRRKEEEKSKEKTIPLAVEHPVKKEDLLSAFQEEMGRPVWLDHTNDESGFRNWDLLLALLLSGLAVSFSFYDPLRTPFLTTIASYAVVLFTVVYTLLVFIFPDRKRIGLLYRFLISSIITILLLVLILFTGISNLVTSLPIPLILLLALATLLLVLVAALRRRSLPPEKAELGLKEIIRRAEQLEILVEHDEETLKALKELEEAEEEPPKEDKPPEEDKKPPKEEIPVIIVEHDEEDEKEWETETIVVEHADEETEETPIIIVEHDKDEQDIEEEPAKEVEKEELSTDKVELKPSLSPTGVVAKVDKDLAYPAEEESEPKESAQEEKKEKVETKGHPVKDQFNYADLVLVPLFACLLLIYFIIPLFPKTPLTVMTGTSILFILAGYSLVVALYPKKFDTKRLVIGILLGILLFVAYQIALFLNYLTLFSESISLWLLIFILIFCLITYFRRGRAVTTKEILQPKKDFEKPNIVNLVNEVVRERDEKRKPEPVPKEEDPFLALRSRAEPVKQVKTDSDKSIKKQGQPKNGRIMNFFRDLKASFQGESRIQIVLSVILIIALVIAISATAYIIIKPKPGVTYTEFYLLGPNGKATNYPTNLTSGQQGKLIIGVVNHEYAAINYQLVVKMNNNIIRSQTINLQNNAKKEIPFTFTASSAGQNNLEFLLYKLPNNQKVYRSLHL